MTGFNAFITHLEAGNSIADNKRIVIHALGSATGGVVDPGVSKKIALMAFVAVWGIWCSLLLFGTNLRRQLRAAKADGETGREIAAGPPLTAQSDPADYLTPDGYSDFDAPVDDLVADASYLSNRTAKRSEDIPSEAWLRR